LGLEPFDASNCLGLLEILEDRIGRKSSIVVSQIPINKWHQVIGGPTIANAICDRIIRNSHRIELKGERLERYLRIEMWRKKGMKIGNRKTPCLF